MKPISFAVVYRNRGHWDIISGGDRLFRIRGTPGDFKAMDERERPYPTTGGFETVASCFAFIADKLMHENLKACPSGDGNNIALDPQPTQAQ